MLLKRENQLPIMSVAGVSKNSASICVVPGLPLLVACHTCQLTPSPKQPMKARGVSSQHRSRWRFLEVHCPLLRSHSYREFLFDSESSAIDPPTVTVFSSPLLQKSVPLMWKSRRFLGFKHCSEARAVTLPTHMSSDVHSNVYKFYPNEGKDLIETVVISVECVTWRQLHILIKQRCPRQCPLPCSPESPSPARATCRWISPFGALGNA